MTAELRAADPRQLEQRVDQIVHPRRGGEHATQVISRLVVELVPQVLGERLRERADRAQRRAQIVRDRVAERLELAHRRLEPLVRLAKAAMRHLERRQRLGEELIDFGRRRAARRAPRAAPGRESPRARRRRCPCLPPCDRARRHARARPRPRRSRSRGARSSTRARAGRAWDRAHPHVRTLQRTCATSHDSTIIALSRAQFASDLHRRSRWGDRVGCTSA